MPKIFLKPRSPEFDDGAKEECPCLCDMPGCEYPAGYKAPKDRSLEKYWHLCLDHVRDYNKAWNYFSGMSDDEVTSHMYKSGVWDRPTYSARNPRNHREEHIRRHAYDFRGSFEHDIRDRYSHDTQHSPYSSTHFNNNAYTDCAGGGANRHRHLDPASPEAQAVQIMGLTLPLTLESIKKRYKELMKKHHPDLRRDDKESEELVKKINMSYTLLRMSYRQYEKMREGST